jgi:hypothetical protein
MSEIRMLKHSVLLTELKPNRLYRVEIGLGLFDKSHGFAFVDRLE